MGRIFKERVASMLIYRSLAWLVYSSYELVRRIISNKNYFSLETFKKNHRKHFKEIIKSIIVSKLIYLDA